MPENKLKPCPFCGREATTEISVIRGFTGRSDCVRFEVYCPACHIGQHSDVENNSSLAEAEATMQKAIEYWNRRVDNGKENT